MGIGAVAVPVSHAVSPNDSPTPGLLSLAHDLDYSMNARYAISQQNKRFFLALYCAGPKKWTFLHSDEIQAMQKKY